MKRMRRERCSTKDCQRKADVGSEVPHLSRKFSERMSRTRDHSRDTDAEGELEESNGRGERVEVGEGSRRSFHGKLHHNHAEEEDSRQAESLKGGRGRSRARSYLAAVGTGLFVHFALPPCTFGNTLNLVGTCRREREEKIKL